MVTFWRNNWSCHWRKIEANPKRNTRTRDTSSGISAGMVIFHHIVFKNFFGDPSIRQALGQTWWSHYIIKIRHGKILYAHLTDNGNSDKYEEVILWLLCPFLMGRIEVVKSIYSRFRKYSLRLRSTTSCAALSKSLTSLT